MEHSFVGTLTFDVRLRVLGTSIKRQLRVNYQYMPPWRFWDPETGKQTVGTEALSLDLEILALPRAEGSMGLHGARLEPYWTSARELLAMGVLNRRVYDQLDRMVDADARTQDRERRQKAKPTGKPPLPHKL